MVNTSLNTGTFCTELAKKTEDNGFYIYALNTGTKKGVDYRSLAEMWRISLDTAKNTVQATTQFSIRTAEHPSLTKRYRTNDRMLRYPRITCNVSMDTFFTNVNHCKSIQQNTCGQLFVTEFDYVAVICMKTK